jgi:hypothetical protein
VEEVGDSAPVGVVRLRVVLDERRALRGLGCVDALLEGVALECLRARVEREEQRDGGCDGADDESFLPRR